MDKMTIRGDEVRLGQLVYLDALSNELVASAGTESLPMTVVERLHRGQSALEVKTAKQILQGYKSAGGLVFAIRQRSDKACIGVVTFTEISWQARHTKLSVAVIENTQYSVPVLLDILRVICQFAYWEANLNRLYIDCHEDDSVLITTLEQSGFSYEGRLRQKIYRHGKYGDTLVYSILQREWSE